MTEINTTKFESKSCLTSFLETGEVPYLLVGMDSEAPRAFYAADCSDRRGRVFRIGVIVSGFGAKVSSIRSSDGSHLVLGYDSNLSIIDCDEIRLVSSIKLESPFFGFVQSDSANFVFVYETGAAKYSYSGRSIWSVSTDILSRWKELPEDQLALCQLDDAKELRIDLTTGQFVTDGRIRNFEVS